MLIYNKYLLRALLLQFAAILVTLTGIVWLTQSMRVVDLIINRGVTFIDFLKVAGLLLPYIAFITIPIASFFSCASVIHRMMLDKEMIVLKSSGISTIAIIRPMVFFSIFVAFLNYAISFYLLPISYGKFKELQNYFRQNYASILLEEGVFNSQIKGFTVYVNKKLDSASYSGIMIYDNRQHDRAKVVFAQEGRVIKSKGGNSWFELHNGTHEEKNKSGTGLSVLHFDKYSIDFNVLEEGSSRHLEPNERYIGELLKLSSEVGQYGNQLFVQAHFRLSWPLTSVALCMLASVILVTSSYRRKERLFRNVLLGFAGAGMLVLYSFLSSLAVANITLVASLYILPLLITSLLFVYASKAA